MSSLPRCRIVQGSTGRDLKLQTVPASRAHVCQCCYIGRTKCLCVISRSPPPTSRRRSPRCAFSVDLPSCQRRSSLSFRLTLRKSGHLASSHAPYKMAHTRAAAISRIVCFQTGRRLLRPRRPCYILGTVAMLSSVAGEFALRYIRRCGGSFPNGRAGMRAQYVRPERPSLLLLLCLLRSSRDSGHRCFIAPKRGLVGPGRSFIGRSVGR